MASERPRLRLRAGARCADPLHAADQGLLSGAGLWRALRMGALRARAVPTLAQAAGAGPRHHRHHGGALSAGQGRSGARRALQFGGEILPGLLGRYGQGPRPAHLACGHRPQAHHGRGSRHLVPAAGAAPRRRARPHRRRRPALPRPADQPQPPRDAGDRLPGGRGPLQGRRRRCGDPGRQLPRLPPEHRARRASAGGGGHRHRGDGLRQGHRRACRRAAPAVLRLPARQCGRPAEGCGLRRPSRWSWR